MPDVPSIGRPPVMRVAPQRASERLQTLADSPMYVKGLIYGDPGAGKALALDTPIPTVEGFKPMGNISVGDTVFDGYGKPTKVVYLSPIYFGNKCYKVCFDDGTEVIADADHLWKVQTAKQRGKGKAEHSIVATKDIACNVVINKEKRHNYSVTNTPFTGTQQELPLPPYTLGIWLGDGTAASSEVTSPDTEVFTYIEAEGIPVGAARECNSGKAYAYRLGKRLDMPDGIAVQTKLRQLGVYKNKHIPTVYLFSSLEQRLALLQGLMDSDGHVARTAGKCELSFSVPQLVKDASILLAGLGIKHTIKAKLFTTLDKLRVSYRMNFTTDLPICKLTRKKVLLNNAIRPSVKRRFIVAVEEVPTVPVRCIMVDSPDHTYMCTEQFITTHNTYLACTAPNPILILSDYMVAKPTLQALRKHRGIDPPLFIVNSFADFEEAYNYVASLPVVNNPEAIPTVIIDSLTDLNDRIMDEVLAEGMKRPSHPLDQLEQGDWNKIINRMYLWVRKFRDLPMHTIMTSLVRESKDGLSKGPLVQPASLCGKIPAFFNLVGYLSADVRPKQASVRRLQVDSSTVYVAKNPGNSLASIVENPDLAVMIPEIINFLKEEVDAPEAEAEVV